MRETLKNKPKRNVFVDKNTKKTNEDRMGVKKGGKIPPQLKKFVMAKKKKAKMKKKKA